MATAFMMAIPFLMPNIFAEVIFFAYVPFLSANALRSWRFGFVIGILFYCMYTVDIALFCYYYGDSYFKWAVPIYLIVQGGIYAGCWAWLACLLSRYGKLLGFVLATALWWWYTEHYFFYVFGNSLQNPILPLLVRPAWRCLLEMSSVYLIWLLILLGNYWAYYCLRSQRIFAFLISCLVIAALGLWPLPAQQSMGIPEDIVMCSPGRAIKDPEVAISWCVAEAGYHHNSLLVFPESMVPDSNYCSELIANFPEAEVIVGTHREDETGCYNSLIHVNNGRIMQAYDKRFLLPLAECVPCGLPYIKNIFLRHNVPFEVGKGPRIFSIKGLKFFPLICSEFFFHSNELFIRRDAYDAVLVAAHDDWFEHDYFARLMNLYARKINAELKRPIVYVSYRYAEKLI